MSFTFKDQTILCCHHHHISKLLFNVTNVSLNYPAKSEWDMWQDYHTTTFYQIAILLLFNLKNVNKIMHRKFGKTQNFTKNNPTQIVQNGRKKENVVNWLNQIIFWIPWDNGQMFIYTCLLGWFEYLLGILLQTYNSI